MLNLNEITDKIWKELKDSLQINATFEPFQWDNNIHKLHSIRINTDDLESALVKADEFCKEILNMHSRVITFHLFFPELMRFFENCTFHKDNIIINFRKSDQMENGEIVNKTTINIVYSVKGNGDA